MYSFVYISLYFCFNEIFFIITYCWACESVS